MCRQKDMISMAHHDRSRVRRGDQGAPNTDAGVFSALRCTAPKYGRLSAMTPGRSPVGARQDRACAVKNLDTKVSSFLTHCQIEYKNRLKTILNRLCSIF